MILIIFNIETDFKRQKFRDLDKQRDSKEESKEEEICNE